MPPRWRNHREPTGPDTPTATAASSLVKPSAILTQNARSTSRRGGGRPGDRIGARPVFVDIHAAVRPNVTPLLIGVLRRPLESAQYLAIRYTERLDAAGAVRSVGSKGDSYDNAAAESLIGLYKTELIRRRGPWRGLDDVELATLEYVDWFNHRRLHSAIGDIPPVEYEDNHYRQIAGLSEDVPAEPSLH
jgi:Integrase core domain